jgi:signal transduction histidine kinase
LQKVVSGEPHASFELTMIKRDGSLLETLWTTSATEEKEKVFCILHDISERKAAQKLRNEMVQMVSQELRAPLMSLSEIHSLLRSRQLGELNEKGQRLLAAADTNTTRMLRLIDDLLDIEKLEAGLVELHRVRTDLVPLIDQAIESVLMLAGQKQINLVNASAGSQLVANVDPNRIIQILVNLVSNALKFSPPGSNVALWLRHTGTTVEMHVADQGRGIPPHLLKDVFNRFQQVQRADATEKGGSGLGLAICKSLVELHGGNISVESTPGRGSDFIVRLPLG